MVYKKFKTIDDLNVRGKRVLLRVDLNSGITDKKPVLSFRIKEHAKTIAELKKKKARVVVLAHQSRPGKPDFTSLKNHSKLLRKFVKINFIPDIIGGKSKSAIENLKEGDAILLDNVRFLKEEYNSSKNNKLINFFRDRFDIYINDAFSICHRFETSITQLPRLSERAIGRVLENELKNIEKVGSNVKNALFILGGNKMEDIMLLVNRKNILPTGRLALLVLKAKGYNLGEKEEKLLKKETKNLSKVKKNLKNFVIPLDLAFDVKGKRRDVGVDSFPVNYRALDMGKKTIDLYGKYIMKSSKIFWKGTAGNCLYKDFCWGTKELLKLMERSKAFCVVAGGHTGTEIKKYNINQKKLGYVSLSGGALVHYIAGKRLPGLEALK